MAYKVHVHVDVLVVDGVDVDGWGYSVLGSDVGDWYRREELKPGGGYVFI